MEGKEGGLPLYEATSLLKDIVGNEGVDFDENNGEEEAVKLAETVMKLKKELQNYKANNERMLAQLNDRLTNNLSEIQR